MSRSLEELAAVTARDTAAGGKVPDAATLASWDPVLSGDMDMVIRHNGEWEHEGQPIKRPALKRLFAALLRREADGHYYLLTPVEKWRIRVEGHALQVIDIEDRSASGSGPVWVARLDTGGHCQLGGAYTLHVPPDASEPWLEMPNGLSAQISRAAWYRLIEAAQEEQGEAVVYSAGQRISLGAT